ncbi:MAG: glycosyltransferase family 4 protein, partial [Pseudomonadota bacterium]
YPEGFAETHASGTTFAQKPLRAVSEWAHHLVRGKKKAAALVVANERTARGLPKAVRPERVHMIVENGVDLGRWKAAKVSLPDSPRFIYVGRLVHWKAVDLLLSAMGSLKTPATLEIVGKGPDQMALEQQAARLPAHIDVQFKGFLPVDDVRDHISKSTALILPSVWECGGAVVLEAMACGKPVIATDWGGPQDYITAETGILVPPTSPDQLVQGLTAAMEKLIAAPETAVAIGERGRARIENHFSWAAKCEAMLKIYNSVLTEKSSDQ